MENSDKRNRSILFKKISSGMLSAMAAMALLVTSANVSTSCWFVLGQDELPNQAKTLRRF